MKVIIPMAGLGTRMRPHTFSRPKPLINVAGQPMLKHLIDSIVELNADEYIFIVGYLGEQIEAFITENYNFKAQFVEQKELIGQAHAIYLARDYLNGPVVILFSDTLFKTDLGVIHRTDADAVMFVREVEDPRRFGVVVCDENGHVTQFIEKPNDMANRNAVIGLYYVKESQVMLRAIEKQMERKQMTKGEFFLADAFQIMIDEGAVFKTQKVDVWLDCGKPETVLSTNRYLLENGCDNSAEIKQSGVTIIPPVNIHPSAKLEHAIVGPNAAIGAGCEVSYSIIKDSIINAGAHVHNIILDSSLIGEDATVAGAYHTLNVGDKSTVDFS
ncbi:MAG: NTP transferase domain-containing protein [Anaerolineae bacterium]|nr:NTP transferase domain-containing protein [Anaerolineae bacterium]